MYDDDSVILRNNLIFVLIFLSLTQYMQARYYYVYLQENWRLYFIERRYIFTSIPLNEDYLHNIIYRLSDKNVITAKPWIIYQTILFATHFRNIIKFRQQEYWRTYKTNRHLWPFVILAILWRVYLPAKAPYQFHKWIGKTIETA